MKIAIYGIGGKMGKVLYSCIRQSETDTVACGVDKFAHTNDFVVPVYSNCLSIRQKPDCIIDFSVREGIYDYLPYAVANGIPCIIATTGYNEEELEFIENAAKSIPVFKTGNMSVGINLLLQLVKIAAKTLTGADIEIIEQHHNQKVDAPSGTALLLADGIRCELEGNSEYVYGREGQTGKRTKQEIGIHAVRGGTVSGKHEVLFMMDGEVVTLKHEVENKKVLALGSIRAAHYLIGQPVGIYTMENLLN